MKIDKDMGSILGPELKIDGNVNVEGSLLIYGTVGGLVTSYYVPKKKLLFGLGGALTTMYLIDYLVRVVDDKDYNPIPVKYRGKQ